MRTLFRALDVRMRQYYSFLLKDVPQELIDVLQRVLDHDHPNEDAKIDRVRPGGGPHLKMPPRGER